MRQRFTANRKTSYGKGLAVSLIFFAAVLLCFYCAVSAASDRTKQKQEETLEYALTRSITHCYAIEGRYPESLSYLKENYGLTYNENLFYVDYQTRGIDMMPDVTVIVRKGDTP